ncbi:MAG: phage portal protein [Firmicutes bacterium]|nr:phage portal protein [Bacillota bacterium]
MTEYKGIPYLRRKLNSKRQRVLTRYKYYEMKNVTRDFGISTPPDLALWQSVLGWCGTAVDALADRIVFREFEDDNFNLNEIFEMNNPDIIFDSAVLSATISSCCFIYISPDEDGYPRLQVIDGSNATGIIDPITGLLEEGYAVLKRNSDTDNPTLEAYFTKEETRYIRKGKKDNEVIPHKVGYPLLVPIIFRPDAKRPFGRSRISRSCMSLVGSALRTIKRSEISAEFFSFPQKYVTGLSEDAEPMDKWKATMAAMLSFTKDEDGEHPIIGQFAQQSMTPHLEQLKMFAALFAGETGLTLDDLGFATANPSSSEAIKAAHENLRYTARKAQRSFGSGFLNTGYLAACLRDNYQYERRQLYLTKPTWQPIFEPDAAALSGAGDALLKLQQAFPEYITDKKLYDLTGI